MEIITTNAQETEKLGETIGLDLKSGKIKNRVLAFYGDLGSGKTTFIQGLAKGLGIAKRLLSPTFVFCRQYELEKGLLYHVDLYRIKEVQEAQGLGLEEMFADRESVTLVEWADRIKEMLPRERMDIALEYMDNEQRKITIKSIK